MGEAACRGPRERHFPGPDLALNGPACLYSLCIVQMLNVRLTFAQNTSYNSYSASCSRAKILGTRNLAVEQVIDTRCSQKGRTFCF